ncbi:MAG: DUF3306 domain-containing protein [Betaproteobacteria bacterium]
MSRPENSEREKFFARWSSRKLANHTQSARQDTHAEREPRDAKGTSDGDAPDSPPFDVAQLPPLDSIGADTDITAFLHRDVPPDLTRAALRRAWTSDPTIRDFVGLVENGWDFNDPSAMSGFGALSAEEIARLAGTLIEALPEAAPEDQTKDAAASEKKSQLASVKALPAAQPELTPKMAEPGHDISHDAAQQSETRNKS